MLNATQIQITAAVPNDLRTVVPDGLRVEVGDSGAIIDRLITADGTDGIEIRAVTVP